MPVDVQGLVQGYANSGAAEVNANAIGTIGPYASTMSNATPAVQQYNPSATTPSGSGLSKFGHFLGGIASQVGGLAEGAAKWAVTSVAHMATSVPREVQGIYRGVADNSQINWNQQRTQQNSAKLTLLSQQYKAGSINKSQYQSGLNDLIKSNNQITKDEVGLNNRINLDKTNAYKAMIDSASTVATVLTAGVGELSLMPAQLAEKSAADYLAGTNATAMMSNVESGLKQFASDPAAFGKLSEGAQKALQNATAEIVAQAAPSMTSQQIARATAANLALKYPFYFSYLSGTGHQIYQELDQQKYGQAVRTIAYNSLLMLSGGPIGQALKYGGKALEGIGGAAFGRSSFVDELSRGIGDGSPQKLYSAIVNTKDFGEYKFFDKTGKLITLPTDEARARIIQNIKSLRAVNMGAVAGKDEVAAAGRVLNGMTTYEGLSMRQFTHEEALLNMSNFAEAQRAGDFYGEKAGFKGVTMGRVDARDKARQAAELASAISGGKDVAHNALDSLVAENSQRAWANNDNYIRQLRSLINKYDTPDELGNAINKIKADTEIEGFPKDVSSELSKMGYIPIQPKNLKAPFKEGSSEKLGSAFATNNDFFKKAVTPIPGVSHMGTLLTMMGVSPNASESRAYQMYNSALGEKLAGMDFLNTGAFKGESPEHTADNVVKQLSDWTHQLNAGEIKRGGVKVMGASIRPPVMDLKQLMDKDIAAALEVSPSQAKQVGAALRESMLEVPLAVRGLGDRAVDVANNIPLFRSYMRVQGAGRFAWNPVFQGKLVTKTEAASQALSGGKVPVMFENILGRGPQIDATRQLLRDGGVFEAASATHHEVAAGSEAVADGTAIGANLTHKLLPMQEKSIAGMINKMAGKAGMSPPEFMDQFPTEVRDTVQMIAQYDRNSSFLHSPLARTLNVAIFPFRFEYKVASIMTKALAQTDTLTQVAVINGLMNAHDWLNSKEGMAWYSKNSEVLKLVNYFTPTMTLATVGQMLSGLSHADWRTTVGAWELGGLPFGIIPQLLNNEGVNLTPGYVDPTSGQPLPKQIPNTSKAQLQVALGDFIGSLFTYPGSAVGLESKSKVDKFLAGAVSGGQAKSSEFSSSPPYLSARQQRFAQTIQSQNQPKQGQVQQPTPNPDSSQIPIAGSGLAAPVYKNGGPKAPVVKKLKKGQFKASLPS